MVIALPILVLAGHYADSVTLRFQPTIGKTYHYQAVMKLDSQMTPMTTMFVSSQKILSATGNQYKLRNTVEKCKVTAPANSPLSKNTAMIEKQMLGVVTDITADTTGKIISSKSSTASTMGAGMQAGAQGVLFPAGPIKIGKTWTSQVDMKAALGQMAGMKTTGNVTVTFKLVSFDGSTAKISSLYSGSIQMAMGQTPMVVRVSGTGSTVVDRATGLLRSSNSNVNTMIQSGKMNIKQVMNISTKAL